jgi:hypothetical protein
MSSNQVLCFVFDFKAFQRQKEMKPISMLKCVFVMNKRRISMFEKVILDYV